MKKPELKSWHWLLIAVFFIFFVNLDAIYINLMEARNIVTAREMVQQGNWIFTTLDGLPRYEKPPLPTWITAIFGILLGFKSFVVMRLPSAFISLLLVWTTYKFMIQMKLGEKLGLIAGLILATSFYVIFSGRTNQWDIYTQTFMLVSVYYFWRFFTDDKNLGRNVALAGFFFGCSFLSKGPIGFHALWLPFVISFGLVYKFHGMKKRWLPLVLSLVGGLILGNWWFVFVRYFDAPAFQAMVDVEVPRWGSYNTRPFYYYWNFFIHTGLWTVPTLIGVLFPYLKNRVADKKAYTFTLLWAAFSILLLSAVPEKKPRYLLPTFIPLAMTTAFYIEYLFRKFKDLKAKESWPVYFNFGLIGLIGVLFPVGGYFFVKPYGKYWIWFILSAVALFLVGAAILYFLIKKKDFAKVFWLTISLICVVMTFGFPLNQAFVNNPERHNIDQLREWAADRHLKVYEYGKFAPQIVWEYGAPIPNISKEKPVIPQEETFGLLVQDEDQDFVESLEKDFTVTKEDRFDINYVSPEKRGYNEWQVRNFYILKRK